MKKTIIILAIALLPAISFASFDVNLKYGAKGDNVKELQEFFIDKGFLTGTIATGNFYSLTLKAVKSFQAANQLPSTGYFGIMSRTAANQILSEEINNSDNAEIVETGVVAPIATTTELSILNQKIVDLTKKIEQQLTGGALTIKTPIIMPTVTPELTYELNNGYYTFFYRDTNGVVSPLTGVVTYSVLVDGVSKFTYRNLDLKEGGRFQMPDTDFIGVGTTTLEVTSNVHNINLVIPVL